MCNDEVKGVTYEEKIPFAEVKKHGDFGLGTFDNLDEEMVMLDGTIYQIASDGRVSRMDEEAATPFACVTFYKPLSHDELGHELTYEAFLEWVHELLPSFMRFELMVYLLILKLGRCHMLLRDLGYQASVKI